LPCIVTKLISMSTQKLQKQLQKVMSKALFLKRKCLFEYEGTKLYASEVHLLLVIQEESNANATQIAERIGVTKGAISQLVSRLERKGLITKAKDHEHKNELILSISRIGLRVLDAFQTKLSRILERNEQLIQSYSADEHLVISRFLKDFEVLLDGLG